MFPQSGSRDEIFKSITYPLSRSADYSSSADKPAEDSSNAQEEGRAALRKDDEENGPRDEDSPLDKLNL